MQVTQINRTNIAGLLAICLLTSSGDGNELV
jgi:hypothetical protein